MMCQVDIQNTQVNSDVGVVSLALRPSLGGLRHGEGNELTRRG